MNSNSWINLENFATTSALRSYQGTLRFFLDDVILISDINLVNENLEEIVQASG